MLEKTINFKKNIVFILIYIFLFNIINIYAQANNLIDPQTKTDNTLDDTNKRLWNLKDVDILALIGEISRISGKNFIIDPRISGKATLVSDKPMSDKEAYNAFLSILQILGYAVIDNGTVSKIIPTSDAKAYDTKFNVKDLDKLGDEMVVQVIPVEHVSAVALIPILRSLVSSKAHIAPYSPSNVIIIADHASNVVRIKEIIKRIDLENTDEVEIIPLKDASADEVVKVLNNLLKTNSQSFGEGYAGQIKLAVDSRTNSILLGGDKSKRLKMRALIAQMDVPTPRTGNTEVIWLQYQDAEDLVPVVASVIDVYYNKDKFSAPGGAGGSTSSGGPTSASNVSSSSTSTNNIGDSGINLNEKRGEGQLSAPGVRAEPNTNSLVVTAPPELMRSIKAVINKLDTRRQQILVEALIVEVNFDRTNDLGIEWRTRSGETGLAGGTNFPSPTSTSSTAAGPITTAVNTTGDLADAVKGLKSLPLAGLTLGFLKGGNIKAILHALSKDTNTNIISTPTLVSMDNSPAEIIVAENIPFKTQTQNNLSGGSNNINSFEYKNVGLQLIMTPSITKGDAIRLTIDQKTNSVKDLGTDNNPTTLVRSIKTAVVVNNKDVLVLGGLIQAQRSGGISKVPLLGDIPILGRLFSRDVDTITKKNLMVFIRPVIIRNRQDSNNISYSRYDMLRDSELLHKVDPYGQIAQQDMPELPDLNSRAEGLEEEIDLPNPFNSQSIFMDILEKYNHG